MHWSGKQAFVLIATTSLLWACKPAPVLENGDRLIASVYNENLYWSEIEDIIPKDVSAQDSQLFVTGYINRWIKDQLMMREAERNIPKELNLEQLVNDYRKSLIRYNYEKILVENYQDSTVSNEELRAYYEKNKSQYPLKYTIIRCLYFKVDDKDKNLNKLRKAMAQDDVDVAEIADLGSEANIQFTDTTQWYRALDILDQIPGNRVRIRDLDPGKSFDVSDSGFHFVLRVIDRAKENDLAPMTFIQDQLTKLILHQKRFKYLENITQELYDQELRKNNIKIYIE
ncbi:MAG: peptidylprolyl isomerase [Saprospiraceae bacterium]